MSPDPRESVIAVFERHPYWGPELQRQFQRAKVIIKECRSVGDLFPAIAEFQDALLIIDLEPTMGEILEWLGSQVANRPCRVPIIALGTCNTAELEWVMREAGVTAFLPDLVTGNDLARLCRRQLNLRV